LKSGHLEDQGVGDIMKIDCELDEIRVSFFSPVADFLLAVLNLRVLLPEN
jgi:hypothetical protein